MFMENNIDSIREKLKDCFDVKYRDVDTMIGKATLVYTDELCGTALVSQYIVGPLSKKVDDVRNTDDIIKKCLYINNVGYSKDLDDSIYHILSGDVCIFIDGAEKVIYCEAKGYAKRSVGEPDTESVLKGPREGFTEVFVDNLALLRRKAKNPNFKIEVVKVGSKSETTVCICYIKGMAPDTLVDDIKKKLNNMNYRFILDTNYIESKIRTNNSLFDTVGYTEKPDEVMSKLMEGRIAIVVDGTPSVLTIPYFFLENFQAPDDYYLNKRFANFSRILRWVAFYLAMFLPGLYTAVITYHFSMIPSLLVFRLAVARAGVPIPTFMEIILVMIFFQLIKEAGLRLPKPIGTAMSLVSALILGDTAVKAGISSTITIFVIAISTLSYFIIPKIYGAISIWAMILVLFASVLGLPGFFLGQLMFIAQLSSLESVGFSYVYPIGTMQKLKFKDVILRGKLDRISNTIISKEEEVSYEQGKDESQK